MKFKLLRVVSLESFKAVLNGLPESSQAVSDQKRAANSKVVQKLPQETEEPALH